MWARLLSAALLMLPGSASAGDDPGRVTAGYAQRAEVRAFVDEMVAEHGFDKKALLRLFAQARFQPKVVDAMSRPVVAPPKWYEYFPQFLSAGRIEAGIAFWQAHAATLARAQDEFGVPAEVIVAIIGVETYYGRHTGNYRAIDALTTLAFDYPRRSEFFRSELKQFLLLAREQHISPLAPKGSFAGALGLPQFMPGSFRAYAIDYDGDGSIDLAQDVDDAIGSVAHYLARHDWQPGQPVNAPALIEPEAKDVMLLKLDGGISERRTLDAWESDGVSAYEPPADLAPGPVGLLMLEESGGPSYWLVFNNWYVLTRYNKSRLYASAVWELAQAVKSALPPPATSTKD